MYSVHEFERLLPPQSLYFVCYIKAERPKLLSDENA